MFNLIDVSLSIGIFNVLCKRERGGERKGDVYSNLYKFRTRKVDKRLFKIERNLKGTR